MIIEFFGVSGVGKSTLCKKLYKVSKAEWPNYMLYEHNNWFMRNVKKSLKILVYSFFNCNWVKRLIKQLKKYELSTKDELVLLFNGCYLSLVQKKCNKKKKTYLFDEGIFQYIWSIYLRSDKNFIKEDVKNIIKMFTLPEKVIFVSADANVIYNRLVNRNRKTKILNSHNVLNKISNMQILQKNLLEIIKSDFKNIKIEIINNNEGDIDEKAIII